MSEEQTNSSTVNETLTVEDPQTETVTTPVESDETSEGTTKQPSIEDLLAQNKRLESALAKANKDAKTHRFKVDELSKIADEHTALKERIAAEKLSAEEKQQLELKNLEKQLADAQKERDDERRRAQERTLNYEVRLQAAQMGIVDPDVAARLLDWSEIEYDDNGSPTNVQDLLDSLVKTKPYLKAAPARPTPTSGGATNPSRSTTTAPKELSWDVIGKLTEAEYKANASRIQKWIAEHSRR